MSEYVLYSFWRSSCSARLRIALNLKGIPYATVSVDLLNGEQASSHHKSLNPSASVPLLLRTEDSGRTLKIGQSLAAMEYLDEAHTEIEKKLLPPPSDVQGRALVRVLADIIACDSQPVTNLRIMKRVAALGGDAEQWNCELIEESLVAYEAVAASCAGVYSYGDNITMADACLVPAVWNARRFGVDLSQFPTISKAMENLERLEAVKKSSPFTQPDTPTEFRNQV